MKWITGIVGSLAALYTFNFLGKAGKAASFGRSVLIDYKLRLDTMYKPDSWFNVGMLLAFTPKLLIDVTVTNPSNVRVMMQQPFVVIYANEQLMKTKDFLVKSNISPTYLPIEANSEAVFETIRIPLPVSKFLIQFGQSFWAALKSGGDRKFTVVMEKQTRIQGIPTPIVEVQKYQVKF